MRFLVIGAGAIGGYVSGSLSLAGHAVTLVARPSAAAGLASRGLSLTWPRTGETRTTRQFDAVTSLAAAFSAPAYDCLILAVKAYDVLPFIQELRGLTVSPGSLWPPPILALQNGVAAEPDLAAAFGPGSVIAGTFTTPISIAADGSIVIEKARGVGLVLGHPLSQALAAALLQAGLHPRLYPAAGPMKWSKLLANLVGNATSAILDLPVSELFRDPRLYAIEIQTLRECLLVMRGLGYPAVNLPGIPTRLLAWGVTGLPAPVARPLLRRTVTSGRGAKMPSLNLDVQARRPRTEVHWLNGAVADYGSRLGLPTPVNRVLTDTVEALSASRLDLNDFRHQPETLLKLMSVSLR